MYVYIFFTTLEFQIKSSIRYIRFLIIKIRVRNFDELQRGRINEYRYREFGTTGDKTTFYRAKSQPMHLGARISIINADITCHGYFWKRKKVERHFAWPEEDIIEM